ncbi:hypothetical protein [Neosynechococcus sphagnicola]|uniref:hypothetical protein n=1 Tax=Neosynechococcus sphagnicola TaxID=1501145 RepID=UPI0012E07A37|nr:hypothetical protein [Neosynechococcus sphagnicola]
MLLNKDDVKYFDKKFTKSSSQFITYQLQEGRTLIAFDKDIDAYSLECFLKSMTKVINLSIFVKSTCAAFVNREISQIICKLSLKIDICFFVDQLSGFIPFQEFIFTQLDFIEFISSTKDRLKTLSDQLGIQSSCNNLSHSDNSIVIGKSARSLAFVLHLVQDYEIQIPLIQSVSSALFPKSVMLILTSDFIKKPQFTWISSVFESLPVIITTVNSIIEAYSNIAAFADILVTSSESSAKGHEFCHELCRILPSNILKITIQHGFENVGLQHSREHSQNYGEYNVKFASDVVLTWTHPDQLENLHLNSYRKCFPVGICKNSALQASLVRQSLLNCNIEHFPSLDSSLRLLIAENLHSVRLNDEDMRTQFLDFINVVGNHQDFDVVIRSHPGGRWLEKNSDCLIFKPKFYSGNLRIDELRRFSVAVSPPSSFVMDVILSGTPVFLWQSTTSNRIVDMTFYKGLQTFSSYDEFSHLVSSSISQTVIPQFLFLAHKTFKFDGTTNVSKVLYESIFC